MKMNNHIQFQIKYLKEPKKQFFKIKCLTKNVVQIKPLKKNVFSMKQKRKKSIQC